VIIKVPLPEDAIRLAKARGIKPEELAKAAETLLLLEAVSMDSKLEREDALKLAKEVPERHGQG